MGVDGWGLGFEVLGLVWISLTMFDYIVLVWFVSWFVCCFIRLVGGFVALVFSCSDGRAELLWV